VTEHVHYAKNVNEIADEYHYILICPCLMNKGKLLLLY